MRRILAIAEKPSIARHILAAIAAANFQSEASLSQYNPIYRFAAPFDGGAAEVLLTSVTGHIREIRFAAEWESWQSVDPSALLARAAVAAVDAPDKLGIVRNLEALSARCTDVFLWLDCDREGEAIAYEVLDVCARRNAALRVHRARFSSVVASELQSAFQRPTAPNPLFNAAVRCRQEVDLRSGSAFTRFQTLELRARGLVAARQVVSYGPCQFPTLALIVERFIRNRCFRDAPFWSIAATVAKDGAAVELVWARGRLFEEYIAAALFEYAHENAEARVRGVERRRTSRAKPLPLTTVEMQKIASNKLRLSSDAVMRAAETLYTRGFISYPRTETNAFSAGFDFRAALEALRGVYPEFVGRLLDGGGFAAPRAGGRDDRAHPPIHPVRPFDGEAAAVEGRLYDLVARHFLAVCARDAETETVDLRVEIGGEAFHARGTRIIAQNFLEIYAPFQRVAERFFPTFEIGERVELRQFAFERGKTSPPRLLTEAELIGLMDKLGIGTDATLAEHIKHVIEREFAEKPNGLFQPTRLGFALFGAYRGLQLDLINPEKRAETEKLYTAVANGERAAAEVLTELLSALRERFAVLQSRAADFHRFFLDAYNAFPGAAPIAAIAAPNETAVKCPQCDGRLRLLTAKGGTVYARCDRNCGNAFFFAEKGTHVASAERLCVCGSAARRLFNGDALVSEFCDNSECRRCLSNFIVAAPRRNERFARN